MNGLHFLAWYREGLAAAGGLGPDPEDGSLPARRAVPFRVQLEGLPEAGVEARLFGPGEVTGVEPREVLRMEPAPGSASAEPHFFAFAEFRRPDFPWLFTPGAPDAQGRLQPWLTLVVVPEERARLETGGGPLPVLVCPLDELPDLADAWGWAHAQVALNDGETAAAVLAKDPGRALSRIVSPRRMLPRRRYRACLVPTFEAGRIAGLGGTPAALARTRAWEPDPENPGRDCDPIPVYHHWTFETGEAEDFDSLARRLVPTPLEEGIGLRPMDLSRPGGGIPDLEPGTPGTVLGFEGALRAPVTLPTEWEEPGRESFRTALEAQLDVSSEVLAPPLYGGAHAGVQSLPDEGQDPQWLRDLNLDPRHRAAAALGTRVIQQQQEALVAAAWTQAQELERANQALRHGELASAVTGAMYEKRLAPGESPALTTGQMLQLASPTLDRVGSAPAAPSVRAVLDTTPAGGATSAAFRRVARPHGPVARRLAEAARASMGSGVVVPLALGEVQPVPKPPQQAAGLAAPETDAGLASLTPHQIMAAAPEWGAGLTPAPTPDPAPPPLPTARLSAAMAPSPDGSSVFVTSEAGGLFEARWTGNGYVWTNHDTPPFQYFVTGHRPVVSQSPRRVLLAGNGALVERRQDDARWDAEKWSWRDYGRPPGTQRLAAPPAGEIPGYGIFVVMNDGNLWLLKHDYPSGWHWQPEGNPGVRLVAAAVLGTDRVLVLTEGGAIWSKDWLQDPSNPFVYSWQWRWIGYPRPQLSDVLVRELGPSLGGRVYMLGSNGGLFAYSTAGGFQHLSYPRSSSGSVVKLTAGPHAAVANPVTGTVTLTASANAKLYQQVLDASHNPGVWTEVATAPPGGAFTTGAAVTPQGVMAIAGGALWRRGGDGSWQSLGEGRDDHGAGYSNGYVIAHARWAPQPGFLNSLVMVHPQQGGGAALRVGRRLDLEARVTGGWTEPRAIPPLAGTTLAAAGCAMARLRDGSRTDLVVAYATRSASGGQTLAYRAGFALDTTGTVTGGWSPEKRLADLPFNAGGPGGAEIQAMDVAVADLDADGREEIIVVYARTAPGGGTRVFVRVGWDLDAAGDPTGGWSEPVELPGTFAEMRGLGVAVGDTTGQYRPDLVLLTEERTTGGPLTRYHILYGVNARGTLPQWAKTYAVPPVPGRGTVAGAGLVLADFSGSGQPDLAVVATEQVAGGGYQTVLRVGRDIHPYTGEVQSWGAPVVIGPAPSTGRGLGAALADIDPVLRAARDAMSQRFATAAANHHARIRDAFLLSVVRPDTVLDGVAKVEQLAARTRAAQEPTAVVEARLDARVVVPGSPTGGSPGMRPLLAAPSFPQPMYEPLLEMSQELLFPGASSVPPESATLLRTNPTFIEAYMVGLNHELARELLWREFPAERRATFFRRFWDVPGGTDVPPLEAWDPDRGLGSAATGVGAADMLVLLIRGELLRRFPGTEISMHRAVWSGGRRVPDTTPGGPGDPRTLRPRFRGRLDPDMSFFGFELRPHEAMGDRLDAGWFVVLRQPASSVQFGLNSPPAGAAGGMPARWDSVHWGHLAASLDELKGLRYARAGGSRLTGKQLPLYDEPVTDSPKWGWNAAHLAQITFQRPAAVALHATELIPPTEDEMRITAVRRGERDERRILELGGPRRLGGSWRMPVERVVAAIERGERFYVEQPADDRVGVVLARTPAGRKYVKTVADGDAPNNLLSLPALPEESA